MSRLKEIIFGKRPDALRIDVDPDFCLIPYSDERNVRIRSIIDKTVVSLATLDIKSYYPGQLMIHRQLMIYSYEPQNISGSHPLYIVCPQQLVFMGSIIAAKVQPEKVQLFNKASKHPKAGDSVLVFNFGGAFDLGCGSEVVVMPHQSEQIKLFPDYAENNIRLHTNAKSNGQGYGKILLPIIPVNSAGEILPVPFQGDAQVVVAFIGFYGRYKREDGELPLFTGFAIAG